MSGDNKSGVLPTATPATDGANVPRSGAGADTALQVMIKKRQLGPSGGEPQPLPADDAAGHAPAK